MVRIVLIVSFYCLSSCVSREKPQKNEAAGNFLNDRNIDTSYLFKDFDLFSMTPIPFAPGETIKLPAVEVREEGEEKVLMLHYLDKKRDKRITFSKINGFWETRRNTVNRHYQGLPKSLDRIIVVNDSTVLDLGQIFKYAEDNYPVTSLGRYIKRKEYIQKDEYSGVNLTKKNLVSIQDWDSVSYRKHSLLPSYYYKIFITEDSVVTDGVILPANKKDSTQSYYRDYKSDIGSSSFLLYLFYYW